VVQLTQESRPPKGNSALQTTYKTSPLNAKVQLLKTKTLYLTVYDEYEYEYDDDDDDDDDDNDRP
jgi:hypothetical protein